MGVERARHRTLRGRGRRPHGPAAACPPEPADGAAPSSSASTRSATRSARRRRSGRTGACTRTRTSPTSSRARLHAGARRQPGHRPADLQRVPLEARHEPLLDRVGLPAAARLHAGGDALPLRHEPGVHDEGGVRAAHREGAVDPGAHSHIDVSGRWCTCTDRGAGGRRHGGAASVRGAEHALECQPVPAGRGGAREGLAARALRGRVPAPAPAGDRRHHRRRLRVRRAAREPVVAQSVRPADQGRGGAAARAPRSSSRSRTASATWPTASTRRW